VPCYGPPVMTEKKHEALELPLAQRVDYLIVVASMAGVDVKLEPEETAKLKTLCRELGLPDEEMKKVLFASQAATAAVVRHLEGLKESPLRFALLKDCVALGYADGVYDAHERAEVRKIASGLGVAEDQVLAIEELVEACAKASKGESHKAGEELAENLAGAGIPIGILAAASAIGLEVTGAATGLAALGMGLGIATGFGAFLGLGAGTYMGVRWLQKRVKESRPSPA
jgi:uncharacterized tellurite resistance protein B-like protein